MKTLKKISTIVIVLIFVLFQAAAQDDYESLFADTTADTTVQGDSDSDFSTGQGFKLSLSGEHIFIFHAPISKDYINFDSYIKSPKFKNELGIEISFKTLELVSYWNLDLVMNEWGNWDRILEAYPGENYIAWSPWKFNLSAGFQEFSWGTGDGINPTDNVNPLDYRLGFGAEKLPVLSAYAGFYPVDFLSLEVIYVPYEQADKFETSISSELSSAFSDKGLSLTVTENSPEYDFTSFTLGGKVNFFLQYIDFSISYMYNLDSAYTADMELTNYTFYYAPSNIKLNKKRLHHFGADFKTNAGIFGLWGEVCYTMSEDYTMSSYEIRNHSLSWVTGFDFNYGPNDDFYFNFQYTGTFIPGFDDQFYNDYTDGEPKLMESKSYYNEYYYRFMTNYLGGVTEGLYQGIITNFEWPVLKQLLTPSITAAYFLPLIYDYDEEIRYGSMIIKPELDIMPFDSFHIVLGADLFFAWYKQKHETIELNKTEKIGQYFKDNNIYLEIRYKWGFDLEK